MVKSFCQSAPCIRLDRLLRSTLRQAVDRRTRRRLGDRVVGKHRTADPLPAFAT